MKDEPFLSSWIFIVEVFFLSYSEFNYSTAFFDEFYIIFKIFWDLGLDNPYSINDLINIESFCIVYGNSGSYF